MKGNFRSLRPLAALSTVIAAVAIPWGSARAADPPSQTAPPAPPTEIVARERPVTRSFYGWQILATGEAGGIVAATSTVLPDSPLKTLPSTIGFLVGMPFYVLGGPASHWTHGDFQKGLVSLSANFALPVVSGLIGEAVRCGPTDAPTDCGASGFFAGFAIALVTVPVIDALVLGWEDIPDDDPVVSLDERSGAKAVTGAPRASVRRPHASMDASRVSIVPTCNLGPKGELRFGVVGRF